MSNKTKCPLSGLEEDIPRNVHYAVLDEKNFHIKRLEAAIRALLTDIDVEGLLQHIRKGTTSEELLETERDALRARVARLEEALKDEVRMPLTEWEEAEKARVQGIKGRIEAIQRHASMGSNAESSGVVTGMIASIEAVAIDESFAEFATEAAQAKDKALTILRADLEYCLKREAEQAELQRLRSRVARLEEVLNAIMARTEHGVSPEIYAIAHCALEEK